MSFEEKIIAQKKYCKDNLLICFIDDGICPFCHHNIMRDFNIEEAGIKHITSCEKCKRSLCE